MVIVNTILTTKGFCKKDKLWFVDLDNKSTNFKVPEFGGYHTKFGIVSGYSSYISQQNSFRDYYIRDGLFTKRLPYWNTFREEENAKKLVSYANNLLTHDYVGKKWRELPQNVINKIKAYALSLEPLQDNENVSVEVELDPQYELSEIIVYDDGSYKIKSCHKVIKLQNSTEFLDIEKKDELSSTINLQDDLILEEDSKLADNQEIIVDSLDKGYYRLIKTKGLPGEFIEFRYNQAIVTGVIANLEISSNQQIIYCINNGSEIIRLTDSEILSDNVKDWCIATEFQPGDFINGTEIKLIELYRNRVCYKV